MTAMHWWRSYSTATVWNDHALANWSLTWHADSSYLRHTWLAGVSDPASHKEYVPISLVLIAPTFQHGLPAWITDQVQQKPTSMKKTSLKAGHETETPSKIFLEVRWKFCTHHFVILPAAPIVPQGHIKILHK